MADKTEFLELPQWDADDNPQRLEFNEAFRGIDDWAAKESQDLDRAFEQIKAKADPAASLTLTLPASAWTGDGPYEQMVTVEGVSESTNGLFDIIPDATEEQEEAFNNARIRIVGQGDGSVTFRAKGDLPEVAIPIQVVIYG